MISGGYLQRQKVKKFSYFIAPWVTIANGADTLLGRRCGGSREGAGWSLPKTVRDVPKI
jgi:hypothetical protein